MRASTRPMSGAPTACRCRVAGVVPGPLPEPEPEVDVEVEIGADTVTVVDVPRLDVEVRVTAVLVSEEAVVVVVVVVDFELELEELVVVVLVEVPVKVNLSALPAAEVPPGVVIRTSTLPGAPPGEAAMILVADLTVNDWAAADPNVTLLAPVNPVPVIVTAVAVPAWPLRGLTSVTVGTFA